MRWWPAVKRAGWRVGAERGACAAWGGVGGLHFQLRGYSGAQAEVP